MNTRYVVVPVLLAVALTLGACGQQPQPATLPDTPTDLSPTVDTNTGTSSSDQDTTAAGPAVAMTAQEAFVAGGPRRVAAAAVVEALDSGTEIVFVDARPPMDYEFGHIPGALSVPYFEAEEHLDRLPRDKWIVAYCECPHAEAEQVAQVLESNGYNQVRVINEGLQGWRDLGRETVGGAGE